MKRRPAPWWWADWFERYDRIRFDEGDVREDPRDDPESPSFQRDVLEVEPRIDCWWDEQAEDRVARGKAV